MELCDSHLLSWIGWQYSKRTFSSASLSLSLEVLISILSLEEFVHVAVSFSLFFSNVFFLLIMFIIQGSPPSGTLFDPCTAQLRPHMLHLFSRPYPSSVAGDVKSFHFNFKSHTFKLHFTPKFSSACSTTIISINEDEDANWGEWVVGLERVDEKLFEEGLVKVEKVRGCIKVVVEEKWQGDLRIVLKQKNDVRVLD